eukprot:2165760-Pleurochrysis_carterae.AAC.2
MQSRIAYVDARTYIRCRAGPIQRGGGGGLSNTAMSTRSTLQPCTGQSPRGVPVRDAPERDDRR